MGKIRSHFVFILVFLLALFLRIYRIEILTTFGRDQGIDFLIVRDMIINHNWTLIGIKTSIGEFFQGPLYRYMLIPMFWIMKLDPIAGAYTAVVVAMVTLLILYHTVYSYINKEVAIYSSLLFSVSPQLVRFGNTPLYQHFVPLSVLVSVYLFLSLYKTQRPLVALLLGIAVGASMELHYLSVTLAITFIIYFAILYKNRIKYIVAYILGLLGGLSPTIAFELRHQFLNVHLFVKYLNTLQVQNFSILTVINTWIKGAGIFFGANSHLLGGAMLVLVLIALITTLPVSFSLPYLKQINNLAIILFVVNILASLVLSNYGTHYPLPLWVLLILIIPAFMQEFLPKKMSLAVFIILVGLNLTAALSQLNTNHGYFMPAGWSLKKIEKVGLIIAEDTQTHPNFNVASLLTGDTKAYPLRYVVEVAGMKPGAVEHYPQDNYLYVVARNDVKEVVNSHTWEIKSLSPFQIGASWNMNDNITLYRLDRVVF